MNNLAQRLDKVQAEAEALVIRFDKVNSCHNPSGPGGGQFCEGGAGGGRSGRKLSTKPSNGDSFYETGEKDSNGASLYLGDWVAAPNSLYGRLRSERKGKALVNLEDGSQGLFSYDSLRRSRYQDIRSSDKQFPGSPVTLRNGGTAMSDGPVFR